MTQITQWCDHSPRARHSRVQSQVGLRKHHHEQSWWRWWNYSWAISNPKWWCCESAALSSVQFSRSVVSDSLWPHEPQHTRPPCPSPTPRVHTNPYPLCQWCHPTILSSVVPFSSCLQSFPASGSFQMSQFFASGCWTIGVSVSASVLPMNIQDWFPLGLTGWISLQSKGLSRVFSNTTVQKHQFFGALHYKCSNSAKVTELLNM